MLSWLPRPGRKAAPPRRLFVVPHTHWDREWYRTFQEFRYQLVEMMDELLDLLAADPEYRHFTLDGQVIAVEDYLEVRPERASELAKHVQAGRLSIGPWYVLPDEFLVSGEALVRNLLVGRRVAAPLGPVMLVGYLPDPFGHVAQLPQILRGFGIQSAVLWRGIGDEAGSAEFIWRAPDGSEVLVLYLAQGYNNAAALAPAEDGLVAQLERLAADLQRRSVSGVLALMNGDDHAWPQRELTRLLGAALGRLDGAELAQASLPEVLAAVEARLAERGIRLPRVAGELRSSRYSPVLAGVLSTRMWIKQRNAAAETLLERWAEPFCALAAVHDPARAERRQAFLRQAWKYLLQNQPHDSICGCGVDQVHEEMRPRFDAVEQIAGQLLDESFRVLVGEATAKRPADQWATSAGATAPPVPGGRGATVAVFNPDPHPRTDLVTATIPLKRGGTPVLVDPSGQAVPVEVLAVRSVTLLRELVSRTEARRLGRILGLSGATTWTPARIDTLERLARLLIRGRLPAGAVADVTVRPGERRGVQVVDIVAGAGGRHNYAALSAALRQIGALLDRPDVEQFDVRLSRAGEADVAFVARDLPPLGYRCYRVEDLGSRAPTGAPTALAPSGDDRGRAERRPADSTLTPAEESAAASGLAIANEFFRVAADPVDGTLTVTDLQTGVVVRGLNRFVDGGDAGDEYTYSPPAEDELVDRPSEPPRVSVRRGPARSVLTLECTLQVPQRLAEDRRSRSARRVALPIRSEVTLTAGVRRVDVRTEVENTAEDHRLRVHFPTGRVATVITTEGHFSAVARPVAPPAGGWDWSEQPSRTQPQRRWLAVGDRQGGLLIGNRGLPEYEAWAGPSGVVVALTLLRSIGWLSRGDLPERPGNAGPAVPTPGAQCLGRHLFEYCLVPYAGGWEAAFRSALEFGAPLRALVLEGERDRAALPAEESGLALESRTTVLSAFKPAEDGAGLVLRLANLSADPDEARVRFGLPVRSFRRVRLDECEPGAEHVLEEPSVRLVLRGGEIVTLWFEPGG